MTKYIFSEVIYYWAW